LTIIERNGGVRCKSNSRVVEKSSSCVANINSKCFSDCKSYLLEGVDRWCWGRVGMSVEALCLCEFPIMVGEFEGAFWAWKVHDLVLHCSGVGFCRCECDRVCWLCIIEKGLEDWSESSKGVYCYGD
jgi:hypothetical protein